eukprot:RCo029029
MAFAMLSLASCLALLADAAVTLISPSTLSGAGSTLVQPLAQHLATTFIGAPFTVSYTGNGSGAGKAALEAGQYDFACSEAALTAEEIHAYPNLAQLPLFLDGVAVPYNLPGWSSAGLTLNLTMGLLAEIYGGRVVRWNDPKVVAVNPNAGGMLPNATIIRYVRGESSGTTLVFTSALQTFDSSWPSASVSTQPVWPNATLGTLAVVPGSADVAVALLCCSFAIGYVGSN